ncbi:ArsB/NhaD family transporter [Dactylosporangium matsuzakiense]|uniref:Membrane protein n=1 Tax=Dactylosporangium matsuzakiense TaxID=53360 RepID=A0A9W6NK15_9ACTN|nr:ArsB/NhaD family transporter [Dactylosporangium matsuzakiense]UWZ42204.1 ArsB/NhaD family transporter [Dactylosporangium matsuzakiense]GLK99848.1 membrane protein [Dactylosporangium matsuzakiense]
MTVTAWIAVAVFAAAYILIATEWVHRVAAALGGAVVMLLIGATDAEHAFFDEQTGIDWNVLVLLLGMMLIVAVLKRTGAFEYLAIWAVKRARGKPFRVMAILVVVTAVASAMLDNVTTVLLIAPVTFLVCERLAVPVAPFLIAEAMASNIGGTATLVGDPPNIIIASRAGLSYNDFLVHLAPIVALLMVVFIGLCRVLFRKAFQVDEERATAVMTLRERDAIRDSRLLGISLAVLAVVTAAFALHSLVGLEPSIVAVIGGLVLLAASRLDAGEIARDVEWPTLIFFAGLFTMIGALVHTGVIGALSRALTSATEGRLPLTTVVLLGGSAVLSAIVDNIPYVATISPIVADLVHADGSTPQSHVLWWALALGADLGGNATAVGASANVVILGLAERAGQRISFWQFTRYGLVVAAVTVAVCVPYLWLRYFAFT